MSSMDSQFNHLKKQPLSVYDKGVAIISVSNQLTQFRGIPALIGTDEDSEDYFNRWKKEFFMNKEEYI